MYAMTLLLNFIEITLKRFFSFFKKLKSVFNVSISHGILQVQKLYLQHERNELCATMNVNDKYHGVTCEI